MQFQDPPKSAEFLKRYKRFFADVRLKNEVIVAHVPNTGSLKGCLLEGADCVVTESCDPARKLKATLQLVRTPTSWVGVNTNLPNLLAQEAWESGLIEDWRPFKALRREYKISAESRIDLALAPSSEQLTNKKDLYFVEIKNVTYADQGTALFPDAVTTRGQKHLSDLIHLRQSGFGAEILFVIQRQDCSRFAPADDIDPEYGRRLRAAHSAGVRLRALVCDIQPESGICLTSTELPIEL